MKRTIWYLSQIMIVFFMVFTISAQQQGSITGGLAGEITDSTGAVLPGATVKLVGPQGTKVLTTSGLGRFSITGLTPGFYDVTVTKDGFKNVESKHNEVVVNVSSTLNLTMLPGSASETVEVTASAVAIDTQSTAISSNLTDTFYNSIPMPRNVSAIFYAAPGVAGGQVAGTPNQIGPGSSNPSIGGASALENLYVVDGVTITDQAFGSIGTYNRYHGSLGTGINLAFIKEVDISTTAFPAQFGKATGGIVQIVTKSGSNQYHGAIGAYFQPGAFYASSYQFSQFGYEETAPSSTLSSPQYDLAGEFGGYIPGFKDKLFFFGAFDPALTQTVFIANPLNAVTSAHGPYTYSATGLSWSGKLTYKLGSATTLEASSFGDPSKHNTVPITLSTTIPNSVSSSYRYGSRDSVARLNTAITPSWVADVSYAYNYNHFNETPLQNSYQIADQSGQGLTPSIPTSTTGYGAYEPSKNDTYSIAANTSKTFGFLGQHVVSIGYSYDHTDFLDQPLRSGPLFAIPSTNEQGTSLASLFSNIPARSNGAMTNAQFNVVAADPSCAVCSTNLRGQKVYASINRGTYVGLNVQAAARYHTAYASDEYQMNRYITLNIGGRWEEERIAGDLLTYPFTGSWSPRMGINFDPLGDHKSKIFFNFGRNYWDMPLDAAIRQLGNEQDDTAYIFAPVVNADGTYTIIPDAAHTLNGLTQSTAGGAVTTFGSPSFASSTGEGIIPGTKGEYEDEYVIGFEHELTPSIVVKARYTDRRLGRIIEDIGSQSPEGSTIIPNFNGGITNPGPGTDIAVNEQEITYTPAQYAAAQAQMAINGGAYVAPVAGCTKANDAKKLFIDGKNQPVGGACFTNVTTADAGPGDGIPDGFVKPVRRYQAVELELLKRFSNHWMADINYRWGTIYGNYEGAYRNDNGQSDPGISSLFDFTPGKLGLLGDQFANGDLSTDRRNVGNLFLSYLIGSDTPFVHRARGLTVGAGVRGQSGVPLSLLGDHPVYLNQGEVPIGGRGAAGRTASSVQLDMHLDYLVPLGSHFSERYKLKLAMDMFNVTNSQFELGRVQFTQNTGAQIGVAPTLDTDYGRPTAFQTPFYARGSVRFEF